MAVVPAVPAAPVEVTRLTRRARAGGVFSSELSYVADPFEIVCEELCGSGHGEMNGTMIVVSKDQYARFLNKVPPGTAKPEPTIAPSSQPSTAPSPPVAAVTAAK